MGEVTPLYEGNTVKVTSATVSLSVIRVGSKQMTISVYWQLPEKRWIGADGEPLGIPWGWINKHNDDCSPRDNHAHVIWQRGQSLFRWAMPRLPNTEKSIHASRAHSASKDVIDRASELLKKIPEMLAGYNYSWLKNDPALVGIGQPPGFVTDLAINESNIAAWRSMALAEAHTRIEDAKVNARAAKRTLEEEDKKWSDLFEQATRQQLFIAE